MQRSKAFINILCYKGGKKTLSKQNKQSKWREADHLKPINITYLYSREGMTCLICFRAPVSLSSTSIIIMDIYKGRQLNK